MENIGKVSSILIVRPEIYTAGHMCLILTESLVIVSILMSPAVLVLFPPRMTSAAQEHRTHGAT